MSMTTEQKASSYDKLLVQRKKYHDKRNIRIGLLIDKAVKAGIIVTEAEVDAEVKKRLAKK